MNSFHLDPNTGNPRRCNRPDNCDWAAPEDHYESPETARKAYELSMEPVNASDGNLRFVRVHKRNPSQQHTLEVVKPVR